MLDGIVEKTDLPESKEGKCSGDAFICKYCRYYKNTYLAMRSTPMCRWLTISPTYSSDEPELYINNWKSRIEPFFKKVCKQWLGVFEVSEQQRIHIHLIYILKDRVKEYIYLNAIRNGSKGLKPCMVRVYDGVPMGGLHYLFKDIEVTAQLVANVRTLILSDKEVPPFMYM